MNLQTRWHQFAARPFPPGVAGTEIDGIDLAQVDTFAAGCISTHLQAASLDPASRKILAECARELDRALPTLTGQAREYFEELAALTAAVLAKSLNSRGHR